MIKKNINTLAVHKGSKPDPETRELKIPIYSSNTFAYPSMEEFFTSAMHAYSPNLEEFTYFYT
ncbi:MAG: hypothetical protein ACFE9L_03960 [Candidatus Hodarchaeota archaeon]